MNPFRRSHERLVEDVDVPQKRSTVQAPLGTPVKKLPSDRSACFSKRAHAPKAHAAQLHPCSRLVSCTLCGRRFQVPLDCPAFQCMGCRAVLAHKGRCQPAPPSDEGSGREVSPESADSPDPTVSRLRRDMNRKLRDLERQLDSLGKGNVTRELMLVLQQGYDLIRCEAALDRRDLQKQIEALQRQLPRHTSPSAGFAPATDAWGSSAGASGQQLLISSNPLQMSHSQPPAPWPDTMHCASSQLIKDAFSAPFWETPHIGAVPGGWTRSNAVGQGETAPSTIVRRQASHNIDFGSSSPQGQESVSVVMPKALADMSSDQLMMLAFAKRNMELMQAGHWGLAP